MVVDSDPNLNIRRGFGVSFLVGRICNRCRRSSLLCCSLDRVFHEFGSENHCRRRRGGQLLFGPLQTHFLLSHLVIWLC